MRLKWQQDLEKDFHATLGSAVLNLQYVIHSSDLDNADS